MAQQDFAKAAKLRDVIRKIVTTEINVQAPPPRVGVVEQIDRENNRCWVRFTGDEGLTEAAMTYNNQPNFARFDENGVEIPNPDVVRVGGKAGAYYLIDVLSSAALNTETSQLELAVNQINADLYTPLSGAMDRLSLAEGEIDLLQERAQQEWWEQAFYFSVATETWTINHNQGSEALMVATFDLNGDDIEGNVRYISPNTLVVDWATPQNGKAVLRK